MTELSAPINSQTLAGKVALVTGASSGLGWRFVETLASAGAKVAFTGRRLNKLAALKAQVEEQGGEACALELEVADAQALLAVVDDVTAALGPIDILVNNAGMADAQYATKLPIELIDNVIDVNLRAPFILSCEVARRMIARKSGGRIVNIASSGAYLYDGNGAALYSVTKAGIVRMTEALAVEWARFNINVNAIAPGAFHSDLIAGMIERVGDFSSVFPRKRICDPPMLDSTLLYLCSPASEAVTGAVIRVDDGQYPR